MITKIKNPPVIKDIENLIFMWLELLASEKYLEAFEFTMHDPYYKWTPKLLEEIINGYGLPHEDDGSPKCKVTNRQTATNTAIKHYKDINLFDKPQMYSDPSFLIIGDIYYDLPIDNVWSDLTATFKILQTRDFTTLELNEIHVF